MTNSFKVIENAFITDANWEALEESGTVTWLVKNNGDRIDQTFTTEEEWILIQNVFAKQNDEYYEKVI